MSKGGRQLPSMQAPSALRTSVQGATMSHGQGMNVRPMEVAKAPLQMKKSLYAVIFTGVLTATYMLLEPSLKDQADQSKLLKMTAPVQCAAATKEYKKCLFEKLKKSDQCMPVLDAYQRCMFANSKNMSIDRALQ